MPGLLTERVWLTALFVLRASRPAHCLAANGKAVLAVVVPVFAKTPGHVLLLVRTLEHVRKQTRAPDYVVLVDDGGPLPVPLSFAGMEQVHLHCLWRWPCLHRSRARSAPNLGARGRVPGESLACQISGCLGTAPLLISCSDILPCLHSMHSRFCYPLPVCMLSLLFTVRLCNWPCQCRVRSPRLAALHATRSRCTWQLLCA